MIELMEGVEDIPGAVMHEGLEWTWESFPEYLDALEKKPRDVDVCALLPHAAVRVNVMGDRAMAFEPATPEDIAKMRAITKEAVEAGAFGVSTSRTTSHKTLAGGVHSDLARVRRRTDGPCRRIEGRGQRIFRSRFDWITDTSADTIKAEPDPVEAFGILKRVAQKNGRPMVYTLAQRISDPETTDAVLEMNRDAYENEGVNIRPVFPPRAIGILLGLQASQTPFSGCPTFKTLDALPLEEKVARLRDPNIRAQILSEDPVKGSTFPLIHRMSYAQMFHFVNKNYLPQKDQSVAAIAQKRRPQCARSCIRSADGKWRQKFSLHADYQLRGLQSLNF